MSSEASQKPVYNVKNPFIARLKVARDLTGAGAVKETRHYEIDLAGSGLEYTPGDSLAVLPTNDPKLVEDTLQALGFSGDEVITNAKGVEMPIRRAFLESYSLTEPDMKLMRAIVEKTHGSSPLADLTDPEKKVI